MALDVSKRNELVELTRRGKRGARRVRKAQVLLMSHKGWLDFDIADSPPTSTSTIYRTKRRSVEGGVEDALSEVHPPDDDRRLSSGEEALLIATACTGPPLGRRSWTLELLADDMVRLPNHERLSTGTVSRRLAEGKMKTWQK
jgi:hypothetical protein